MFNPQQTMRGKRSADLGGVDFIKKMNKTRRREPEISTTTDYNRLIELLAQESK